MEGIGLGLYVGANDEVRGRAAIGGLEAFSDPDKAPLASPAKLLPALPPDAVPGLPLLD